MPVAISSGANTPSESGDLRYVRYASDMYLHDNNDDLDTERFDDMPSKVDAETDYEAWDILNQDIVHGAWVRRGTH